MRGGPLPLFVWGAGGLLAGELLRLLEGHPGLRLAGAVTRSGAAGLCRLHPHLATDAPAYDCSEGLDLLIAALAEGPAVLALALPHGEGAATWAELSAELGDAAESLFVCDLSADFRLRDAASYERWYGAAHPVPEELGRWTYGLVEWHREGLAESRRIAAPGCFATALQLGLLPVAREGWARADAPLVADAITGSTGSGARPSAGTHHPHRHGNLWSYAHRGHRHEAELRQAAPELGPLVFLPHSGPFARGIHLAAHVPLARDIESEDARELFRRRYANEPFVEITADAPDLRRVVGSNRAAIGCFAREGVLTVLVTLDNVLKGGAGQALQALNVALGFPETTGLARAGLGAV